MSPMTDWYVTLPYATGLITVVDGKVVKTPPIFRWMIGMQWLLCKDQIQKKGGHGEVVPANDVDAYRGAERHLD